MKITAKQMAVITAILSGATTYEAIVARCGRPHQHTFTALRRAGLIEGGNGEAYRVTDAGKVAA